MRSPLILLLLFLSCNAFSDRDNKQFASPEGYSLSSPVRYRVRQSMQEISGIVLNPDAHRIMAINDEEGKIFEINLGADKPYENWKFAKSGDYEDLATDGKNWMVLKSNGALYKVEGLYSDTTDSQMFKFPHHGKREFESLYYDGRNNSMVAICKNCAEDKGQGLTSAYRFGMDSLAYDTVPAYRIKVADIVKLTNTDIKYFKPSAAAVHPLEKRLYIVASVNRMLVITDLDGNVQEAYNLRHQTFRQPEGISFAPNGDMYISNEAGEEGNANILKFAYKPPKGNAAPR